MPYIRVAYASSLLCQLLIYYYINIKIKKSPDPTVLKYVEAKKPFSDDKEEMITTTIGEYDLAQVLDVIIERQVGSAVIQVCISGLIVGFLHYKWGYIPPLIMQSFMGLKVSFRGLTSRIFTLFH